MQLIVREALVKSLLGEPGLLGDLEQLGCGIVTDDPLVLLLEQHLEHRESLVTGAARQHGSGLGKNVERELAEDQPHLPSVDVLLLQLR